MPIYEYACKACGHREDQVRAISQRDNEDSYCPVCLGLLRRDVPASMRPHTDTGYSSPLLSDTLGVHPDQIAEAKARFPDHRFTPDGRMILESHTERKRVIKELGFYDRG